MQGRVLVIAGSDSGGGAGIQADIKTITALGGYAATALTALTAQNSRGVRDVLAIAPEFVASQIEAVLDDLGADCIKTGMLYKRNVIDTVCEVLETKAAAVPVVADPVMRAKDGTELLDPSGLAIFKQRLLPRVAVLTPNIPEAEALTGMAIGSPAQMQEAASRLLTLGPQAVLVKGGHLAGEVIYDVLLSPSGVDVFEGPRLHTRHVHGTGCTLASAIAVGLAQGMPVRDSVLRARNYLQEAIRHAPGYGGGSGPMDHAHPLRAGPAPLADGSEGRHRLGSALEVFFEA